MCLLLGRCVVYCFDSLCQGEWTTSGRKGKKKGSSDAIVAPGDSSSGGGGAGGTAKTSGGTSRAGMCTSGVTWAFVTFKD